MDRYRPAIVPDDGLPTMYVVCTECVVCVDDSDDARAEHDNYHAYYLDQDSRLRRDA